MKRRHELPWKKRPSESQIANFWGWFASQAPALDLKRPDHQKEFEKRLALINPGLVWGASVASDKQPHALEISADGISERIPLVQAVVSAAPEILGWKIVAFRQPHLDFSVCVGETEINPDTVYWLERGVSKGRVHLKLFLPLSDHKARAELGFLALDHAVGEYLVLTRIGAIDFDHYATAPSNTKPLRDLCDYLTKPLHNS